VIHHLFFPPYLLQFCHHSTDLQFCEIAHHSHEKLMKIQEIVKKVYHEKALTRMQTKDEGGETGGSGGGSEAPQCKISIVKIAAEAENDWQESAKKLVQAHCMSTRMILTTLHRT
jgi:hypothetical protein